MQPTAILNLFLDGATLAHIADAFPCEPSQCETLLRSELHRLAAVSLEPVTLALPVKDELGLNAAIRSTRATRAATKAPKADGAIRAIAKAKMSEPRICAASPEMAMYPPVIRETRATTRRAIWDALRNGPLSVAALAEKIGLSEGAALIAVKTLRGFGLAIQTDETPYRWARKVQVAEPVE